MSLYSFDSSVGPYSSIGGMGGGYSWAGKIKKASEICAFFS